MLGLLESTGPLLGDDPKRLGRFRVITLATTGIMVGVIFANMPAQDHKGRPTILSSVSMLLRFSETRGSVQPLRKPELFCVTISSWSAIVLLTQVQARCGRVIDRVFGLSEK